MVLTGLIAKHFYGITYIIGGMERSSKLYREAYENVKRECAAEDGTIQEGIGPLPIVGSGIDQPDHITSWDCCLPCHVEIWSRTGSKF